MMERCLACGNPSEGGPLCFFHREGQGVESAGWAAFNRRMCDRLHRGILAPIEPDPEPIPYEGGYE